ncbi:hypothetical protein S83_058324 [Arachis hypogaea]
MKHDCWIRDRACWTRPAAGLPNRVRSVPVPTLTRKNQTPLNQFPMSKAATSVGNEDDRTRQECEQVLGQPASTVRESPAVPIRQGRCQLTAGPERESMNVPGGELHNWVEDCWKQQRETEEGAQVAVAGGLDGEMTSAEEATIDEGERRLMRKDMALNTEPKHAQRTTCNLDESRKKWIAGTTSQDNVDDKIRNCNAPEAVWQLRGKSGLGLEEGKILLYVSTRNGNGQEEAS